MPRSACSNLPICFSVAPVNDPFSWPNSSDSISSSGIAAQLTCTNRWPARGLLRWIVRATSSLPTPLSPSSSTVALVGAARCTASSTRRSAGLWPTISYFDSIASFSSRFSERSSDCLSAFCSVTMTRSLLSGLSRKSSAPERMASTAVAVVPCPEIIDDRQRLVERVQLAQHLEAVHPGHLDVEQHQVGTLALDGGDALLPGRRADELVVLVLEDHPQRVADRGLVVDDQNAWFHGQSILTVWSARPELGLVEVERQHVAGVGRGDQAAVVLDGPDRLTVDFEQHVAALDVGVERRAHRIDARDDDAVRAVGQVEVLQQLGVEFAHRQSERRPRGSRRQRLLVAPPRRARHASGRSASFTGTFIERPSRTICSVAVVPGLRLAMI